MGSVVVSVLTLACVVAGGLLGHRARRSLPDGRLDAETGELVKLLSRLISTLVALVLGLLVGSTKATYDAADDALRQAGARFVTLDGRLRLYGPEAAGLRDRLRATLESALDRDWPGRARGEAGARAAAEGLEGLHAGILRLDPGADGTRRSIRDEALAISGELLQSRWALAEPGGPSLPAPFLAGLDAWLAVLFVGFGLMTPRRPAALAALLVCAVSIAGAVFLILELNHPFHGLIQASGLPFERALDLMRR
jgi:hypothetical protein